MTDLEINKALAKSIGWTDNDHDPDIATFIVHGRLVVCVWFDGDWTPFDFRDDALIWRVALRYNCFPQRSKMGDPDKWVAQVGYITSGGCDCPRKAVAMAVIHWARP